MAAGEFTMIEPALSIVVRRSRIALRSHITNTLEEGVSNRASAVTSSTLKPRSAKASLTLFMIAASSSIRPGECAGSRKTPRQVLAAFIRRRSHADDKVPPIQPLQYRAPGQCRTREAEQRRIPAGAHRPAT